MQKQYACFSAAIRDGAQLRPQGFGKMLRNGKSCALGAGAEAVGFSLPEVAGCFHDLVALFPYLDEEVACSGGCSDPLPFLGTLGGMIAHLNDVHQWTREAIADWLYAEEEKLGFVTVVETQDTASVPALSQQVTVASSVRH